MYENPLINSEFYLEVNVLLVWKEHKLSRKNLNHYRIAFVLLVTLYKKRVLDS